MPRIFLSHSHEDRDFAVQLAADLRSQGCGGVWIDEQLHHGDFLQQIDEALTWAEWTILVLTPAAIASSYVKDEVYAALARVKLGAMHGVIPVLAKPCDPRAIPPQWAVLHRYDATADYGLAFLQVAHALGRWLPEWESLPPIDPLSLWAGVRIVEFSAGYGTVLHAGMPREDNQWGYIAVKFDLDDKEIYYPTRFGRLPDHFDLRYAQ